MVTLVESHLQSLEKTNPHLASICTLVKDPSELAKLRLMPEKSPIKAALVQKYAAKCWPYKLVSWVLEDLLAKHARFNLQTNTPVLKLQRAPLDGNSETKWLVHTERGHIAASKVLLATNAYTSYLLPKFSGVIVPVRGQVSALVPPQGSTPLDHSYGFPSGTSDDDYLIHRDDGRLILGGERLASATKEVGISDDSEVNNDIASALSEVLSTHIKLGGDGEAEQKKLEAEYAWTGIMGYSADGSPWVGEVKPEMGGDGKGGLWVSAGYTGHGMPVAARCGIAAAQRMMGEGEDTIILPKAWEASRDGEGTTEWMSLNGFESLQMIVESLGSH